MRTGIFFGSGCTKWRIVPVPLIASASECRSCDDLDVDIWMPSYSPMGGGVIDTSVGREIGIPHIIYHVPRGRRFGDIMNGPLSKIGYRVKGDLLIMAFDLENQSEVCNLTDDDIDGALYFVNE